MPGSLAIPARGKASLIDGAQTFGHSAVDVKQIGCDSYAAGAQKWFLAPAGTGFLYPCNEGLHRERPLWTPGSYARDPHSRHLSVHVTLQRES
jgi:selenocysteine lyase/cysteine desulfurase